MNICASFSYVPFSCTPTVLIAVSLVDGLMRLTIFCHTSIYLVFRREKRSGSVIYDTWAGHYNNIIKDYIEDVYPDVIETFLGATIKV